MALFNFYTNYYVLSFKQYQYIYNIYSNDNDILRKTFIEFKI